MSVREQSASEAEQKICLTCGFCCDGTLFIYAVLNEYEKGLLPQKIEEAGCIVNGKYYFRQPCSYFSDKCTIYNSKRANICSSYRCQLLKDIASGKITTDDALKLIREARETREEIMYDYRRITGKDADTGFMILLSELGKYGKTESQERLSGNGYDILLARCNIFEALLIKHFRSAEDFDKMAED